MGVGSFFLNYQSIQVEDLFDLSQFHCEISCISLIFMAVDVFALTSVCLRPPLAICIYF